MPDPSSFVLDASVALSWFLPGEKSASDLLALALDGGVAVPGTWHIEVGNVLLLAERRGRITAATRERILFDYVRLPLWVDPESAERSWTDTLELAHTHRLTLYDACYLELAMRLDLPLASFDKDLRAAARAEGIEVLGR